MGTINTMFAMASLAKLANKKLKANPDDVKTAASMFSKAKSISSQASKYVMEYPVMCTDSITDVNTALGLAKQVEFDCARFILLSASLNPIVNYGKGDTIELHLNNLVSSYENYSGNKCTISVATPKQVEDARYYMDNIYSNETYNSTNRSEFSLEMTQADPISEVVDSISEENDLSENDNDDSLENNDLLPTKSDIYNFLNEYNVANDRKDFQFSNKIDKTKIEDEFDKRFKSKLDDEPDIDPNIVAKYNKLKEDVIKATSEPKYVEGSLGLVSVNSSILNALGKQQPTIINVSFRISDGNSVMRDYVIPLAIKSNIHFINSNDIKDILTKVNSPNNKLHKFIQWSSGEISFFKDILLGLEDAKKDTERERELGQVPIYRRLMSAKNRYHKKNIFGMIPGIKNMIARKTQKDLPMCTIVITEAELVEVSKMRLNFLLKDRKFIDNIMDTFMLLCFGIIDDQNDIAYFFYSGEDEPAIIPLSKLPGNEKSEKTIDNLSKVVERMSSMISRR